MPVKYDTLLGSIRDDYWGKQTGGIRRVSHVAVGADADVNGTGPFNSILQDAFGVGNYSSVNSIQEVVTGTPPVYTNALNIKIGANYSTAATSVMAIEALAATTAGNANDVTILAGFFGGLKHRGTGVVASSYGVPALVGNSSTGTLTTTYGLYSSIQNTGAGTITNAVGLSVDSALNTGGGTITTNYGLYLANQTAGTTNYNLYSTGVASRNYFGGYVETSAAGGFYLGTTGSINNRFLLNTPAASDSTAEQINTPSSTARKALVLQMNSSQTANAFEVQNNSGTLLVGFSPTGDIVSNTSNGTKIGTSTSQKLAFFNSTPVVQQGSDVNSLVTYGLMSSISNLTFTKETTATIKPADTTTAATVGATLSIVGGKGSNTTSGAGGPVSITGGDGRQGNSAGGAVNHTGGAGVGLAAGGAINIKGGSGFIGGNVLIDVGGGFAGAVMKIGSVNSTMVALGNFTPTATIHIKAGTTSASSAPLKFTTGTNMTTAEVGAMEFSSNVLYFTPSGTNRYAVLLGTIPDSQNITLGTSTGSVIGTATTQKLGFWNATPVVQPTTAVAAATFTANTSGIVNDSATFDGYTIGQVVKALRNIGILA